MTPQKRCALNTVLGCIAERRSIRKFADKPVQAALVHEILEAGRWAPSGLNNQPWRFMTLGFTDPRRPPLRHCTKDGAIIGKAPLLIVVLLLRSAMYNSLKDHQSAGACIQNMLLAAHSLGLGSVWLGEILNQSERVLGYLGLPVADYELMAVLAIGHPAEPGEAERNPLDSFLLGQ
jgi:nitroreductase